MLAVTAVFKVHSKMVLRASSRALERVWWDWWLNLLEEFWTPLQWPWMELKGEIHKILHPMVNLLNPLHGKTCIFWNINKLYFMIVWCITVMCLVCHCWYLSVIYSVTCATVGFCVTDIQCLVCHSLYLCHGYKVPHVTVGISHWLSVPLSEWLRC
jgi:hypothetical protein